MKFRAGFISNSSSCTFVAVLPEDEYDKIVTTLQEKYPECSLLGTMPVVTDDDGLALVNCGYNDDGVFINNDTVYAEDNLRDIVYDLMSALTKATKLHYSEDR